MAGTVKKFKKHKGYESISRNMLQNVDHLSLQAIGLLSNLTSMPDDWTIYKTELYKRFTKNGRTSVQNAWNELVENKYIIQLKRRNGKKYDYIYYHSQEKFSDDDIQEIEKMENCKVWNGKTKVNGKAQLTKQNSSTVDFQQSKMDSPKSTAIKLTINEMNYQDKDLDTIDTVQSDKSNKEKLKNEYVKRGYIENHEKVPKKIAEMLDVFCHSEEEANDYYQIILLAKENVGKDAENVIWLEQEPEIVHGIMNVFSRCIRKIEKERHIENPNGYIYKAIYDYLISECTPYREPANSIYFDWLRD